MRQVILKTLITSTISMVSINSFAAISYNKTLVLSELMNADNEIQSMSSIYQSGKCKRYINSAHSEVFAAASVASNNGIKYTAISHTDAAYKAIRHAERDWKSCGKVLNQAYIAKKYLINAKSYLNSE